MRCKLVRREAWVERTETIPVSNCFQRVKGLIVSEESSETKELVKKVIGHVARKVDKPKVVIMFHEEYHLNDELSASAHIESLTLSLSIRLIACRVALSEFKRFGV